MNILNALNSLLRNAPQRSAAPLVQGGELQAPNRSPNNAAADLSNFSNEVNGPEGCVNPALMQMLYETRLQFDLQGVEFARHGQGDQGQAIQTLQGTYEEAKQKQIPISEDLEAIVLNTLNQNNKSGNTSGGCLGGNCNGRSDRVAPDTDLDRSRGDGMRNGNGGGSINGRRGGSVNGGNDDVPPANLSSDDKKFLDSAISQDPKSFGNLVTSWSQGAEGNCSTVAAVKAAMDRYDNQVFDEVKRTEDGYSIVMQDGYKMKLTNAELAAAKKASRFKGKDGPAKSYATFLYGAAAKRNALDNKMSMRQSLNDLNNGESIYSPAKSLGLSHQLVKVNPRTLNGQDSVVAASRKHAIFVDKNSGGGHTADRWGRAIRYNGTDGAGRKIISAYTFKPRSGNSSRRSASVSNRKTK